MLIQSAMSHSHLAHKAAAIVLCLSTAACALTETRTTEAPSVSAGTPVLGTHTLSDEAKAALAQAEVDVLRAREAFALWTTAESAYRQAKAAAELGDSATVIAQARIAIELVQLGLAQKSYPSTESVRHAP